MISSDGWQSGGSIAFMWDDAAGLNARVERTANRNGILGKSA